MEKDKKQPKKQETFDEKDYEWETMDDGTLFRFENIGDSLSGTLLSVGESTKYPGMKIYEFDTKDEVKRVLGTKQMQRRLQRVELMTPVYMELTELVDTQKGNPLKIFDIKVGKKKKQ